MTDGRKWHPSRGWLTKAQLDELNDMKDGLSYRKKRREYDAAAFKRRMADNSKQKRKQKGSSHDDSSLQHRSQTTLLP